MTDWASDSDDELLHAAVTDARAFGVFYARYERPVLAFFLRRVREPELAADLTAEVFAAALAGTPRFRPGGAPASAWLFGIAQHKLAKSRRRGIVEDRARRRLKMAPIVLDDADLERIERLAGSETTVTELLERLPAHQRDAVRLRVLEDSPYRDIAIRLRCSEAVVRKRVSRGLARLRDQLEEGYR